MYYYFKITTWNLNGDSHMLLRYIGITNTVETMLWNLNGNMITQPSASSISSHTVPPFHEAAF